MQDRDHVEMPPENYLTPEEANIRITVRLWFRERNYIIACQIEFDTAGGNGHFWHNLKFNNPIRRDQDIDRTKVGNAMIDYAKDLVMNGTWREKAADEILEKWPIAAWAKMEDLGFSHRDGQLFYNRDVKAMAKENEIAYRLVLEKLYRSNLPQLTIRSDEFAFPSDAIVKAIEDLDDLAYIEIIARQPKIGEYNVRITAQGRQYYQAILLPTKRLVFIILDCDERFKNIEKLYRRSIGEDFKAIVQERTETKKDTILADIEQNIRNAAFIIADITGKGIDIGERFNPNCVFEAGMAKAMEKKIIYCVKDSMVRYSGKRILPFDFQNLQFSFWDENNLDKFEVEIKERIDAVKKALDLP